MNRQDTHALRFAHKVRQALNESTQQLPPERLEGLAAARKAALRAQKQEVRVAAIQWNMRPAHAHGGRQMSAGTPTGTPGWLARVGLAVALFLIVGASVAGLYKLERSHRIAELAEIDSAVLVDELPISAYSDHGFNAYLQRMH